MKTCRGAALFLLSIGVLAHHGWCAPVDLSAPGGELGAANSKGYLEIWREIDDVGLQLGKGSYLPLRYKFSTDPTTGGILGPGFYMPMFEAKNVLIRESTMRAYLPCGKGLYMWRSNLDPNKFRSVDDQWTGYLKGDDYVVWRDDGWKVQYHKSRLSSITSDDGHLFTWIYDRSGFPQSVSEDGQSLITVEPNAAGQMGAVVCNGKRYEFEYAKRPITEMVLGQVGIKELDQALSSFKYPDGTSDIFQFVLTPDRVPTLNFTGNDKDQRAYTWNPASYYIATEKDSKDDWTYNIGKISQDFGTPPISRTSSDGKTESVKVDNRMGTYTAKDANDITTVTQVFETPGPLYQKIREVDEIRNDKSRMLYRLSYNESGQLIRKMDENHLVTTFIYDQAGKLMGRHVELSSDLATLATLKASEEALLATFRGSKKNSERTTALQDLIIFYITKELNFDKASALEALVTSREQLYSLKLMLAISDPNKTPAQRNSMLEQLISEYPDKEKYTSNLLIDKSP
jgi:YD repeat-containing protein